MRASREGRADRLRESAERARGEAAAAQKSSDKIGRIGTMTIELDAEVLENIFRFANNAGTQEKLWFSMEDCAFAWGFEKTYFHRRKHLLPGFGVFDDPTHKRFSREHFFEWVALPLCEHERLWGALSAVDRRKIGNKREEP